jgi:hypothetical protein
MRRRAALAIILGAVFSTNVARADGASPTGFTFDLSLGAGTTQTSSFYGYFSGFAFFGFTSSSQGFAWMLPSASLGYWVEPHISLGGRISDFWYAPRKDQVVNGYVGPELRYAPVPAVLLAGGTGLMLLGPVSKARAGLGFDLRVAVLPIDVDENAFGFFGEYVPGFVDEAFTFSAGGGIIWLLR